MRLVTVFGLLLLASCSLNNAEEDKSLEKYFTENKVDGTFALFDNITGKFTVHNMARYRDSAAPPFHTYDIITALVGLETGRIKDSAQVNGAGSLALQIGKDTLQRWLDTLGYKPAKITPDEQLGLVKKLYFNQLPFQPRSQRIVKESMKQEDNSNYTLSYKAGQGASGANRQLGWLVGWIEENNHPYFFVVQTEADPAASLASINLQILKDILRQYGFMQGKK